MPIKFENTCEHCDTCINCGRKEKQCILICDDCGANVEELYRYNKDTVLCADCLLAKFDHIDTDYYKGAV